MKKIYLICIAVCLVNVISKAQLIDFGSNWKYYDNEQEPPDDAQGDAWIDTAFDDNSWLEGNAQLGYGDNDESTLINGNTYTAYFRKSFDVADPSAYENIKLDLIYDDGAVVYLNGTEVWRIEMPTGTIEYATFANGSTTDNKLSNILLSNTLLTGNNTIAIEIHQKEASSSDLSFDFKLSGTTLQEEFPDFNSLWKYYDNEQEPPDDAQGGAWTDAAFDDNSWSEGNAQLGYGDNDESTLINGNTYTAYFRKSFDVTDPSVYENIKLDLIYDDGAVVYLNGTEIWRVEMPTGTIEYATFANGSSTDNKLSSILLSNTLLTGNNTIAIEIHQKEASSSDLSFNFKLSGTTPQEGLLNFNSLWKYYDNEQEPPDQGSTIWKENAFDDTSWSEGNGQLGYGDNDENTIINNQTITAYFRHTFSIDDPTLFTALEASLLFDDGGIVYLNGTEIMRLNMNEGTPNYNTLTNGSSGDNALSTKLIENTLVTGSNTIAVEIHQISNTSSDISFDFSLIGKNGTPVSIVRGPYLQKASESAITIKWRTDLNSKCRILYGTSLTSLTDSIVEASEGTEHELLLPNLLPETKYYYEIKDSLGVLEEAASDLYFQTHPTPLTDGSLTAWILGDCGTGNTDARAVRDAYYNYIGTEHTDMMLFLGDNAYNDGTDQQYQNALFENMYEDKLKNTIAWSCLGNHDGFSASSSSQTGPYYDIFSFPTAAESGGIASGTEAYYSFDYGNVHFIVLDSYDTDRSIGGAMYNWCLSDVQATTAKWIVALWHHPPYTKGSHDSDLESSLIQMRERFLPILEDNGVDLVLSGHSHSYERSYYLNGHYGDSNSFNGSVHTVGDNGDGDGKTDGNGAYRRAINGDGQGQGSVYITTGSAGRTSSGSLNHQAMFYSVSELGSCILEINTDTLNVKFLRETGTIEDYFTITKCKGLETVENISDSGIGSIRQKIADACDLDTITFDPLIINPIDLQSEIVLDKSLYFKGLNPNTIITGNNANRIFTISQNITAEFEKITFKNAFSNTDGGAILNNGILKLENVEFENNKEGISLKALTNYGEIQIKENSSVIIKE